MAKGKNKSKGKGTESEATVYEAITREEIERKAERNHKWIGASDRIVSEADKLAIRVNWN